MHKKYFIGMLNYLFHKRFLIPRKTPVILEDKIKHKRFQPIYNSLIFIALFLSIGISLLFFFLWKHKMVIQYDTPDSVAFYIGQGPRITAVLLLIASCLLLLQLFAIISFHFKRFYRYSLCLTITKDILLEKPIEKNFKEVYIKYDIDYFGKKSRQRGLIMIGFVLILLSFIASFQKENYIRIDNQGIYVGGLFSEDKSYIIKDVEKIIFLGEKNDGDITPRIYLMTKDGNNIEVSFGLLKNNSYWNYLHLFNLFLSQGAILENRRKAENINISSDHKYLELFRAFKNF